MSAAIAPSRVSLSDALGEFSDRVERLLARSERGSADEVLIALGEQLFVRPVFDRGGARPYLAARVDEIDDATFQRFRSALVRLLRERRVRVGLDTLHDVLEYALDVYDSPVDEALRQSYQRERRDEASVPESTETATAPNALGESASEIGESRSEIGESRSEISESKSEISESKSEISESKSEISESEREIGASEAKQATKHFRESEAKAKLARAILRALRQALEFRPTRVRALRAAPSEAQFFSSARIPATEIAQHGIAVSAWWRFASPHSFRSAERTLLKLTAGRFGWILALQLTGTRPTWLLRVSSPSDTLRFRVRDGDTRSETRSEAKLETRSERSEAQSERSETRSERSETRSERSETRSERSEMRSERSERSESDGESGLLDGEFHHVVLSQQGAQLRLFVDGRVRVDLPCPMPAETEVQQESDEAIHV
ncbi:MAG: hypothetical protein MHM6MM_008641, partial [Cercozoa sp. M6MM]